MKSFPIAGLCWLLTGMALATPSTVTVTLDSTKQKTSVPANYLGLFDASQIGRGFYDPAHPHYMSLFNIVNQMKVRHYRVEGTDGQSNTALDQFFTFISNTGCVGPSVEWGLRVYDVDKLTANEANASWVLSNHLGLLDAFNFGNESDFNDNRQTDQFIPSYWGAGGDCTSSADQNEATKGYYGPDKANACPSAGVGDPSSGGFKGRWQHVRSRIVTVAQGLGLPVSFVGPDTGSIATVAFPLGDNTKIMSQTTGTYQPWTLQFALDEHANIKQVTQHLYSVDGHETALGSWVSGSPYCIGDEVYDQNDVDSVTGIHVLYKCNRNTVGTVSPESSASWTCMEPLWQSGGHTYNIGDVVRDPQDGHNLYQCVKAGVSNNHPKASTNQMWVHGDRSQYAFPGPHQLALVGMSPNQLNDWQEGINAELTGATGWPAGLTYRMSEFSPMSGPASGLYTGTFCDGSTATDVLTQTPAHTNCFASALLGLEQMHWWCKKGCAGVDPISRGWGTNCPIFQAPYGQDGGDFFAQPWAYAWPAFNLSAAPGSGQELWTTNGGIAVGNPGGYNVTTYATLVSTTDLIITVFNKTFSYADGTGAASALNIPVIIKMAAGVTGNFVPTTVRYMALNSGGTAGDATAMTAKLGGQQVLGSNPTFTETWTSGGNWNGTSFTITVPAFSAMIIDLRH